jgi:hypothetical protein
MGYSKEGSSVAGTPVSVADETSGMKHFLLMRWNLPACLHHSSLAKVIDPRWQARRRELFQRYCLPSVAQQTVHDFTWLFFIYPSIMSAADVRWFQAQDERLRIVSVDDPTSTGVREAREAVARLASGNGCVITTRLDSDDILHPDHLRSVRVEFSGTRRIVEFMHGFYYDIIRDELRQVREPQNAFVSVLEPAAGLRTAWGWGHHEIGQENEILYLEDPGWIALVHDHNTTTYLWGDRVSASDKRAVLREFGVCRPPYVNSRLRRLEAVGKRLGRRASRAASSVTARD